MRWNGGWLGRWVGEWLGLAASTTAPADTGPTIRIGGGEAQEASAPGRTRARSYGPTNPIRFPSDEEIAAERRARQRKRETDIAAARMLLASDD